MLPDSGLISKHSWGKENERGRERRKRERDREVWTEREREREHVYEGKEQRVKNCKIA